MIQNNLFLYAPKPHIPYRQIKVIFLLQWHKSYRATNAILRLQATFKFATENFLICGIYKLFLSDIIILTTD
jgi:hypothetical protein